jgi:GAF domain-containing protein
MSSRPTLDRESFQQLLANAFAVQESRVDRQSLSAIVELQGLIAKGELDAAGVMHLIVDRARNVAHATGVAIGLLKGNRLVYQAGSGGASTYIGRHAMASLTVSADIQASREILRVENAETDTRIEAAICRQFGAKSLLILLIFNDRNVAGLLEVFFSEPHAFQDHEVRAYRLMAGLIEEAISRAAQPQRQKPVTAELPANLHAVEQISQKKKFPNGAGPVAVSVSKHPAYQHGAAALAGPREVAAPRPALLARIPSQRAPLVPWHKRWEVALAVCATVVLIICWIAYGAHGFGSRLGASALPGSPAFEQPVPFQPAKAIPATSVSKIQPSPVPSKQGGAAKTTFKRVRVGKNEVDYVRDDVTLRYFTDTSAPRRPVGERKVGYIRDDVTVRYFTSKPAEPSVPQKSTR